MRRLLFPLLLTCALSPALLAIDVEFLRAWESTQSKRPASISSISSIAPASEPGTKLTIHGRVTGVDGQPVPDAIVFAWQTDAAGVYDRRGAAVHSWRLHGWVRTDRRGAFTLHTVRPGTYPNRREPAHVHFTVQTNGGARYFTRDLHFAGDPLIRAADQAHASQVRIEHGRQHVDITLQLDPKERF